MSKNLFIGILAIVMVLSFLWGQMGNKSKKMVRQELETTIDQLAKTETEVARLQKSVQVSKEQLTKTQNDLVELRKAGKTLEAKNIKNDAVVAVLTREEDEATGQVSTMKNPPSVVTSNSLQQIIVLQKQVADLQAALQARAQELAAAKEISAESREELKGAYNSRVWIKSEVGPAEPGTFSREELQARLAKAESSIHELQEQLVKADDVVQKQKKQLVVATEELAETRAKVKGTYSSRVWIKSELTPVEKEAQKKKELQAELASIESYVQELQEKLAVAEQETQRAKELHEKLAVAEQEAQRAKKLQEKLTKSESSVFELQGKLEEFALSIRDLDEKVVAADQTRFAQKYESIHAQAMGLELMVEERDAALAEINRERDNWNINKDLLLTKISEQQKSLQKLQEMNRGLLRDLAAKKKELANVNK